MIQQMNQFDTDIQHDIIHQENTNMIPSALKKVLQKQ